MTLKRGYIYLIMGFILVLSILIISAVVIKTKEWHDNNNILVDFQNGPNTYTMTLQEAISGGYFMPSASLPIADGTTTIDPGHDASQIWVFVNGIEDNLQNRINGAGLCGSSSNSLISYTGSVNIGHFANEIEISPGSSLQDAIDGENFCVTYSYTSWSSWSGCSVNCGTGTQSRTRSCTRDQDGATVSCSLCGGICSDSQGCSQSCTWRKVVDCAGSCPGYPGYEAPASCWAAGSTGGCNPGGSCSNYGQSRLNCGMGGQPYLSCVVQCLHTPDWYPARYEDHTCSNTDNYRCGDSVTHFNADYPGPAGATFVSVGYRSHPQGCADPRKFTCS